MYVSFDILESLPERESCVAKSTQGHDHPTEAVRLRIDGRVSPKFSLAHKNFVYGWRWTIFEGQLGRDSEKTVGAPRHNIFFSGACIYHKSRSAVATT